MKIAILISALYKHYYYYYYYYYHYSVNISLTLPNFPFFLFFLLNNVFWLFLYSTALMIFYILTLTRAHYCLRDNILCVIRRHFS